jgi:hypothetical protein
MDKITAIMTTIPIRAEVFQKAINSIYKQVDSLRIVFNKYEEIPIWIKDIPKISTFLDTSNKYSDCAKWRYAPEKGYVFSIDDDIRYPRDYISVLVKKLEEYNRKCVVTVHGAYFRLPFTDFVTDKKNYSFVSACEKDVRVDIMGSGTLAYHTDTIRPKFKDFLVPNRSDIWFSSMCHKKKIPIICVARKRKWLRALPTEGETIWDMTKCDDNFRRKNTEYVAEYIIPYLERVEC